MFVFVRCDQLDKGHYKVGPITAPDDQLIGPSWARVQPIVEDRAEVEPVSGHGWQPKTFSTRVGNASKHQNGGREKYYLLGTYQKYYLLGAQKVDFV